MARSRAALLPFPGDPFLLKYWLKFFHEVWGGEVDKLYVLINSPIEKSVVEYEIELLRNDKITAYYLDHQIEHGTGIDKMLGECEEEYVMLIEDDAYIFKSGYVDRYFSLLESGEYDVIGSPRGSCSMEIYEGARVKFGLNYEGLGDHGPNFWPNYFFAKRDTLLSTDRNFCARAWDPGEVVEPLGMTVTDSRVVGDTFVNTSLQLRARFPKERILDIPQYHASPDDIEDYENKRFLFDGNAPWTHIGSLSTGVGGVLIDDCGRPLARRLIDPPKESASVPGQCTTEQERREWERRVAAWELFLQNALSDIHKIEEFMLLYRRAVDRIIAQFGLRRELIEKRKEIFHTLGL